MVVLGAGVLIAATFALGPRVGFEERWVEPALAADLVAWVDSLERGVRGLRPGDGRAIVWADPRRSERTPISLVYLHGFSADRHEMEPVVTRLGRALGANVYFARLQGHGRDGAAMAEATVEGWLADAVEALAIGGRIGERVVVIGSSTGGTLATWLAGRPEARDRLAALVLVSPNYQPKDRSSRMLLLPWGGLLARLAVGEERCFEAANDLQRRHWTTCYPTSALSTMMALVEHVRTMELATIRVPTLVLYSPSDAVVDAAETERVVERIPSARLRVVQGVGDPAHHVLAGDILSRESNEEVETMIRDFLLEESVAGSGR